MNRPNPVMWIAGVGMLLAIAALAWQVQRLQRTVDELAQELRARPQVISAAAEEPVPLEQDHRPHYFKLIEATSANDGTTPVGIPWSVERAMMGDAAGRRR
jgi:hypothetical protein